MQLLNHVLDHSTRDDPASFIAAIDAYDEAPHCLIHLGPVRGAIVDEIVRNAAPLRLLELGTNYGYSAIRLALAAGERAKVVTVEADPDLAAVATQLVDHAGLAGRIDVVCRKASDAIVDFRHPFDLVFIDHMPQNYFADLQALEEARLIVAGTTVVTDNAVLFEDYLVPYLRHLRSEGGYDSRLLRPTPTSDGIEVSVCRTGR